jgi:glycosyltransferase involved in cell wall biosynthesis
MAIPAVSYPAPAFISVIVPVRNAAATISEQLAALAGQTYRGRWQLVIVDNGSSDRTVAEIRRALPDLPETKIIDAPSGRGPSYARNIGARNADGEFLAFCDADDVVSPEWLVSLANAATRFDVVAGRLEADSINSYALANSRSPRIETLPVSHGFLPYSPSGNTGVWATVFMATGGFDQRYRAAEDVEWSWRAQLGSYSIGFAPEAVVHYRYRASVRGIARQAFTRGFDLARLYHDYRSQGLERASLRAALRTWVWTIARLPMLVWPATRPIWIRRAAESAGRVAGSVRFGVLAL